MIRTRRSVRSQLTGRYLFALAGCIAVSHAQAEEAPAAAASAPAMAPGPSSAPVPSVSAAEPQTLQRVTVTTTVRKKLERVQDVPATISILSGSELSASGVTNVRGIEYKIPGLTLGDAAFEGASIGMRDRKSVV